MNYKIVYLESTYPYLKTSQILKSCNSYLIVNRKIDKGSIPCIKNIYGILDNCKLKISIIYSMHYISEEFQFN